ncbi:MAG TPA: beta-N-acetylhexosaminidase, partial [Vicinamibacterales bacterium]|nr:beta-N-acetylhexosaminidase [Vicinamibacterales bacterium]
ARAPRPRLPAPPIPVPGLVPVPLRVEPQPGPGFTITAETLIQIAPADERVEAVGRFLADLIGTAAARTPPRVEAARGAPAPGAIYLALGTLPEAGPEGYELTVARDTVTIVANTPAGLFYGVQTFRQLLPPFVEYEAVLPDRRRPVTALPVRIADRPRYAWRGAMLDVARHFFSPAEIRRYIDLAALYKINHLHLHLSDDQGWRIEIRSWPELARRGGSTEVGGGPGGFYTQEDYAALVAYAAERFVTVVPEIDMPGHTNAALASYPELTCDGVAPPLYTGIEVGFSALCVDKELTYTFIGDVVREIAALTPGPYFHIGGDEVKTLTAEQYARFIARAQAIVQAHGKQAVGWDEIAAAPLLPTTLVQHWRPKTPLPSSLGPGNAVILSPADRVYLDMKYDAQTAIGLAWAGFVGVREAYDWEPAALVPPPAAVAGVEAPLWTETVANLRDAEFLAFPRLAAVAEVGWADPARRDWEDFRRRLAAQAPRWTALGVNFYRSPQIPWPP